MPHCLFIECIGEKLLCEPGAGSGDDGSISRVFLGAIFKRPIIANVDSYDRGN
jgi:hypothetical protein